ncbi:MAG: 5-(carboxyamino)imidazole ribonucleotide mutase, partial [Bdellovibrio sp.]
YSDWAVMQEASKVLKDFGVPHDCEIVSAHRSVEKLFAFGNSADRKYQLLIAGAGGAAALPGMLASLTFLPVIGVPVEGKKLQGLDSLLSIAQMPKGVPVACVAIDNAANAALLAIRILALKSPELRKKMEGFMQAQTRRILSQRIRAK